MTETPMSDAELDALVEEARSRLTFLFDREEFSAAHLVRRLADALTAAQRRDTERDAELAAAVADRPLVAATPDAHSTEGRNG